VPGKATTNGDASASPAPKLTKVYSGHRSGDAPIWKSIQYMDHEAMDILRAPARPGAVDEWEAYLSRTKVS
jgi:hypothetical protein